MTTLTLATHNLDQINSFRVEVKTRRGMRYKTCLLHCGYQSMSDGVYWGMSNPEYIRTVYTEADRAEQMRLEQSTPVRHGDMVQIGDARYTAHVHGEYSDAVVFHAVTTEAGQ